jgi:hypothetical protein
MQETHDINLAYQFFLASDQSIAEIVSKELEKHAEDEQELKR